jgi:hypothetical protein
MNHLGDVARFLDAVAFRKGEGKDASGGRWPFVTISRQSGAGGQAVAEAIMTELDRRRERDLCRDWMSFDSTLLRLISKDPRARENLRAVLDDRYYSGVEDYMRQVLMGRAPQDIVLARVFRTLRMLAGAGKAVIVGHGGALVTKDLPGGVHVRLVAGRAARLATLRHRLFLSEPEARRRLDELEESRRSFFREHFGADIGDPLLYDAVWNTDRVAPSEIASWVVDRVELRARALAAQASQRAASSA